MAILMGSLTLGDFPTTSQGLSNFTYYKTSGYVAIASGTATAISVAVYDWADADGAQFRVGLYDSSKNLLAYGTISGTAGGFISGALNTSVSITSGATYYVAVMATFGTGYPYTSGTYQSSVASASGYPTLPNPLGFVADVATGSIGLAVTGTTASAQTITDINGGDPIVYGSTGNVATTTGFTLAPNVCTVDGITQTITAATTSSTTFNLAGFVDGETRSDPTADQDVVLTRGSETATLSHPVALPTNWASSTVASAVTGNPRYVFYTAYGLDSTNGNKLILDTEGQTLGIDNFSIEPDGRILVNPAYVGTKVFWLWIASSGEMVEVTMTVSQAGVETIGLTARGLTATGLTATGLTARGI